jgi:hypothetical protein
MKKLLLFTLTTLIATAGSFAQGKVVFRDINKVNMGDTIKFQHDINETDLPPAYEIEGYISNVSTTSIGIRIHRVVVKYIGNTTDQICWGGNCTNCGYLKMEMLTETQTLAAGEDAALIAGEFVTFHFLHKKQIGTTILKYFLVNNDNVVEDSLIAVYTLTGPKVTLTFNLDISAIGGFNPKKDKVYVKGNFADDSVQMATWDSITYWVSVPVDLNSSCTYHYSTKSGAHSIEKSVVVTDAEISVNDNFETVGIHQNAVPNSVSSVFPNPVVNNTFITYQLQNTQPAKIVLVNILGKKVMEQTTESSNGTIELILSDIPSGIYFINLEQSNRVLSSRKLIKK